jgi:integrase
MNRHADPLRTFPSGPRGVRIKVRAMPKLTDRFLATFKPLPGKKDRLAFDTECPGLGVRTTISGTRKFIVQWTDLATSRKLREPLGVWGSITIDQARAAVRVRLGEVAKGNDPRAEREARKRAADREKAEARLTLDGLVDDWATLHLSAKRPRYRSEAVRAIKYAFSDFLKRPAARITRADAVHVLDNLVKAHTPAIAGRTLAYCRACYSWARKREKVPDNPFSGLPIPTASQARERVLTDEEIGRVWNATVAMGAPWGPLFRVLLLSLARREEVAAMKWSELSADLSVWTIPASRMKRGQPHVVALPVAAREALNTVTRISGQDLVFSTTGRTPVSGFTKSKAALDNAAGVSNWRLHDIRRTGVSALAGMGIDAIVADMLLAHQPAKLSSVARVYQRHDFARERKIALEAWAAHVLRCARVGDEAENVIPMRATGAA